LHSLHSDLKSLHGPSWAGDIALLPGSTAYVKRLKAVQPSNPELLAAHAYVRYLGDLSGGQMLQKIISRSLRLAPQQGGTDFYNFGDPVEVARLSQAFRAGLKAIESNDVLAEAKLAFEMHRHLFDGLADACGLSQADLKAPL
jgi:heme oxygenase (biliverdin-producing, ferredoxin)